ncbi:MAG: hypothetical protein QOJ62_1575, partial [Actinomycetota bacterium]|nr:hypothetical protein [Actinomycetota bacterium]
YNPGDVPAIIRSIYAFHVQSEGWCDVGYNFLVDKFGRIWEGRFGGIDQAPLGAHTGGFNTNSFGVSMIGEFSSLTPPVAMTDAITRLVAWKFSMAYLNPLGHESLTAASFSQNRFSAGTVVSFNTISGHRDADQTACPGNAGYAVLPFVRNAVMATMVAGLADPATAVTPRTISANGSVRVTSGMLQAGSWQLSVQDPSGTQVRTLAGSGTSIDTTWNMTSDDGQPVAPGSYTLTLTSNQAGASARPWTRTVQVGGSFGSLDGVAAPGVGTVVVQGWALHGIDDQPATVRLTVSAAPADTVTATASRPDVAARYPGYSAAHGFVDTLSTSPGFHTICAYAVNDTGGPDTYLGCRGVTVPGVAAVLVGPAANPVGFLDVVQGGPTAVHVAGWTIDPETTNPISVAVYVDTTFMGFITANTSRPDVGAVHPGYGAAHGFDRILGGVVPGNHRVCVYAMNIGNGTTNPTLGCATVRVPTGNPIGHLDTVSPTPGGIVTWGWALDPDTAAPIPVHVYVDGRLAAVLAANQPRADVARALPVYGYLHGYAAAITMAGGHHVVCEYALNVGAGSANTALGCRSVSVLAGNPIGRLDAVVPVPGGVILWGWSIDPDTRTADSVAISVDGREATRLTANLARPDVQGVYPAYGVAHGFATFLAVSGGAHTVCANGINVAAGSANPQLGCHAVSVLAGNPIGRLEFAGAAGGTLSLWGWAIDPDVTTPVAVHVYVDGHLATILAANANRPDVAKLYPSYGAAHGYQVQLPVAAGTHSVCTYAINVAAGSTNSQLGCRSVKG